MALPLIFSMRKSVTLDEVAHIGAGYSYLRTGEIVLNPMHPPLVKELAALPLLFLHPRMPADAATIRRLGEDVTYQWEFGQQLLSGPERDRIVGAARVPVIVLSVALAALIFVWARALWGPSGGLVALFLYVFDPTVTAHAQLVTTDIGFALFAALFVYQLRRVLLTPGGRTVVPAGVALGLALGAKFSAVALLPISAALVGLALWWTPAPLRQKRSRQWLSGLVFIGVVAAVVLWPIYLFPAEASFYARGLGFVQGDYNPDYAHYLMGEFRTGRWWHYFAVAWLVKTPIPAILAVLVAVVLFLRGRRASGLDEALLIVPGAVLFVGYSLGADPIGLRYILPCYPFLFVFTGRIGPWLASFRSRGAMAATALALWYVFEFVAIAPDHLSYFNRIAGGPENGPAWLDDSNVDWGQGLIQLRDHLREHPPGAYRVCSQHGLDPRQYGIEGEVIWIDAILSPPRPGVLILSGHCLARARAWLAREHGNGPANWFAHIEPKAVIGHAYYVYEIPEGSPR